VKSYITAIKRDPQSKEPLFKDDLWHGALFVNHPTPSGLDRWLLNKSDPLGHEQAVDATKRISGVFPSVEVIAE